MEYCFSADGEYFEQDLQSVLDTLVYSNDEDTLSKMTIAVGKWVSVDHSEFINADHIIEDMQERAYNEYGEAAEYYLEHLKKSHAEALQSLLDEWYKTLPAVGFYKIKDVKVITVAQALAGEY